jgi:hypothetical protein
MAYDARLATRISPEVDLRLRMQALLEGLPLSHVLDSLLDKALPPAAKLADLLAAEAKAAA